MKYLDIYVNYLKCNRKSENTIVNYKSDISQMIKIVNKNEEEIKEDDILNYLGEISNLSSASVHRKITVTKEYFRYLHRKNYIKENPTIEIENVRIENKAKTPLTAQELRTVINNTKNPRDKAIICIFASCGIRFSEMKEITVSDFCKNPNQISIIGKGNKQRFIYLNEETQNAITEYLKIRKNSEFDNLFISNYGNPMSNNCLNQTVKNIAKNAGINKEISCHCFRTTNATLMSQNNVPIEVIKESLGHSSITTTAIYVKIAQSQVKNAQVANYF